MKIPDIFQPLLDPYRYKVSYGGRGGSKSWSYAMILLMLAAKNTMRVLCCREIQRSIEDSVYRLLTDVIDRYEELAQFYQVKQNTIIGLNGSAFFFTGLYRNQKKIKSYEGVDVCWVEEAEAVSQESWDYLIPTIRKEGSEIWVTFNPDQSTDPVAHMFIESHRDGSLVLKTTYRDNPFFPTPLTEEMEYCKRTDYEKYLWIWEGNYRKVSDSLIFKGKFSSVDFETPDDAVFYFGADWGFSNDPTTLIRAFITDNILYIDHDAWGLGVDIDKTPALFDTVPESRKWKIIADSARPETISYIRRQGFNIVGSKKGKGSVEDGIQFLRGFEKIIIHPRCKDTLEEFKTYSWKTDKLTGDALPIPEDKNNHEIDGLRYAMEPLMRNNKISNNITIGW